MNTTEVVVTQVAPGTVVQLKSSNLRSASWEDGKLRIEFLRGGVYEYADVPRKTFDEMLAAESCGKYFIQNVKDVYQWKPVHPVAD